MCYRNSPASAGLRRSINRFWPAIDGPYNTLSYPLVMNDRDQPNTPFAIAELEYDLPEELIAQQPPTHRDDARLLVVNRSNGDLTDSSITNFAELLQPGDLLVLNNTRVVPAKFIVLRKSGGKVRGLFLKEQPPGTWLVMLEGSRRLNEGECLRFQTEGESDVSLTLTESCGRGHWRATLSEKESAENILNRMGQTPLPPYIRRKDTPTDIERNDRARYQTVYAEVPGAIAAPTAGLHFTDEILTQIRDKGVGTAFVTLHVGEGTFKPISVDSLEQHEMHAERYDISEETAAAIRDCKNRGRRIVAIGTTSVRVLESVVQTHGEIRPDRGLTNLFIYPPYRFRVVDALLTNFHLPKSTLLAMVMALGGIDAIRSVYKHAVDRQYRFFSYGDAMFIHS